MKKVLIFTAIALIASALLSCEREETPVQQENAPQTVSRSFTCVFAEPDAKVGISELGKTTWEAGDEILIHGGASGNERQIITLTEEMISDDGKKAHIVVEGMDPYDHREYSSAYYAQYPASSVPDGVDLGIVSPFNNTDAFLMAACDFYDTFVFYNLSGVIAYTVDGDFDKVVFSGNYQEAVGFESYNACVVAYNGGTIDCNPLWGFSDVLTAVTKEVVADGRTMNFIYLPSGASFSQGFTFFFYKNDELIKAAQTFTAVTIGAGQMLNLGDITERLGDYEPEYMSDHTSEIPTAEAIDLSEDKGPANCYVITAPGTYKFPAVKGNFRNLDAGYVHGADLLWETWNNAEEVVENSLIAAVDFENNWIYFQTPETLHPGNALIAARNQFGRIIWSWHIWIPATKIETNTYGLYSSALMDRNLGALVAAQVGEAAPVESFGTVYQWGRKDPFVGPASTGGSDLATVSGFHCEQASGTIDLMESISNPLLMGHTENGDWLSVPNKELWIYEMKTIYDPCPPGYRVPAFESDQPLMQSKLSGITGFGVSKEYGYIQMGDPVTVFPLSGYRDDYSVTSFYKVLNRSGIWLAYSSSDVKAYSIALRADQDSYYQSTVPKSRGLSVRCVVDE